MVVGLSGGLRKVLREIGVDDSVIIGLTTVELAGHTRYRHRTIEEGRDVLVLVLVK
jgi:hypothetical protein